MINDSQACAHRNRHYIMVWWRCLKRYENVLARSLTVTQRVSTASNPAHNRLSVFVMKSPQTRVRVREMTVNICARQHARARLKS